MLTQKPQFTWIPPLCHVLPQSNDATIGACSEPRIGSFTMTSSRNPSFKIVMLMQQAASFRDAKI